MCESTGSIGSALSARRPDHPIIGICLGPSVKCDTPSNTVVKFMTLKHTNKSQDDILTSCEDFGGNAAAAAEIAQDLDNQLVEAEKKHETFRQEIDDLTNKVAELEQQIRDLS